MAAPPYEPLGQDEQSEPAGALAELLDALERTLRTLPALHPLRPGLILMRRALLVWFGLPVLAAIPPAPPDVPL